MRRQWQVAELKRQRQVEAVAVASWDRRLRIVHLASGVLTGLVAGMVLIAILNIDGANGNTLGAELGISASSAVIILLVGVGVGVAFGAYDHKEGSDFIARYRVRAVGRCCRCTLPRSGRAY